MVDANKGKGKGKIVVPPIYLDNASVIAFSLRITVAATAALMRGQVATSTVIMQWDMNASGRLMSMHRPFGLRRSNGHRRRQVKERSKEKTTKLPRQELLVAGVNGQRRKQGKERAKATTTKLECQELLVAGVPSSPAPHR